MKKISKNYVSYVPMCFKKNILFILYSLLNLEKGIGSNLADCFVVPPRNDTFF
jgi:hypothetical protein